MSPIDKYFGGHGEEVMRSMKKKHGDRAKEIFYSTANKRKKKRSRNLREELDK